MSAVSSESSRASADLVGQADGRSGSTSPAGPGDGGRAATAPRRRGSAVIRRAPTSGRISGWWTSSTSATWPIPALSTRPGGTSSPTTNRSGRRGSPVVGQDRGAAARACAACRGRPASAAASSQQPAAGRASRPGQSAPSLRRCPAGSTELGATGSTGLGGPAGSSRWVHDRGTRAGAAAAGRPVGRDGRSAGTASEGARPAPGEPSQPITQRSGSAAPPPGRRRT